MIDYQISHWIKTTFSFHGTALPRILDKVIALILITIGLLLWGREWLDHIALPPLGHTMIGTAMGLVLVFRNNASYDRYWEGRKQWGGIVNSSRNLARAAISYTDDIESLTPLLCAFPHALKHQLRKEPINEGVSVYASSDRLARWNTHPNPSLMINLEMSDWIARMLKEGQLSEEKAQRLEAQVAKLMDHQGACERILNTPVPFAHAIHVRQLLFFYLISLPLVVIPAMGWASIFTIAIVGLGLLGIEEAGVEIEDPFGHDPNDLPLTRISEVICRDVQALKALHSGETPQVSPQLSVKRLSQHVVD